MLSTISDSLERLLKKAESSAAQITDVDAKELFKLLCEAKELEKRLEQAETLLCSICQDILSGKTSSDTSLRDKAKLAQKG